MSTPLHDALAGIFSELTRGAARDGSAVVLNGGDIGLLASLDRLNADEASRSSHGGATIAAHAQHLRYGLSLMNRWAREGGDPFADAKWEEAWNVTEVDETRWREIRSGLGDEVARWQDSLQAPAGPLLHELRGVAGSVAHLAYHMGAIRQIARGARGPREGTYTR